ncbi:hypothetical protein [Clostridium estertheticum]|uniref:hypothetical protein n=1 Tax=Clostridium estertheticum TaxID=238834 RepID=UPI001C0B711E|nr:hypothetical protein [Clostridium estertheticum]MBU3173364.1 hypothetical protein [Clostridium estertheticum]
MSKNICELVMTKKQFDFLRKKTKLKNNRISTLLEKTLKIWYETNKERLDIKNEETKLVKCSFTVDEKTENIYKLFIEDSIDVLLSKTPE